MTKGKAPGTLIVIGGHEEREGECVILKEVVRRAHGGKLVVSAIASQESDELFEEYKRCFHSLGLAKVYPLRVNNREEALDERTAEVLDDATVVFFTGGDQLRITSQLGETPVCRRIQQIYEQGGTIAGTSAGASAVCDIMLVSGESERSARIGSLVQMAPGLGLLHGVIVDQHFAERGRIGRLLGAVAQNPRTIGVGIDEDTAIIVRGNKAFDVIGAGAVYVIDGSSLTCSNVADAEADSVVGIHDVRLHVLCHGHSFDLNSRRPTSESCLCLEENDACKVGAKSAK